MATVPGPPIKRQSPPFPLRMSGHRELVIAVLGMPTGIPINLQIFRGQWFVYRIMLIFPDINPNYQHDF